MKANELIQKLNLMVQKHGDCEVITLGSVDPKFDINSVVVAEIEVENEKTPSSRHLIFISSDVEVETSGELIPEKGPTEATETADEELPVDPVPGEVDAEAKEVFEDAKA